MDSEMIQTVAENADGDINISVILIVIFAVGWLFERIYKIASQRKNGKLSGVAWKDLRPELDKKVNSTECNSFRRRIGKESDEHDMKIDAIKDDISEIKEGIAFLKGKAG